VVLGKEEDSGIKLKSLRVDGGASANDFLMQFQSDILDVEILRPKVIETTALGAAYLAGLSVGYYKDAEEIKNNLQIKSSFTSNMCEKKRDNLYTGWKDSVSKICLH